MLERGGVSCSHYLFLLLYVYGRYDYFVNLKIVSKTTKCRDFTRFFSKMHRDFADFYRDFLTALPVVPLFTEQRNFVAALPLKCCEGNCGPSGK